MTSQITKKWWFWLIIIMIALSVIGKALGLYDSKPTSSNANPAPISQEKNDNSVAYEVVNEGDYGTSKQNHSFRVVVDAKVSDDQLLWVFNKLDSKKYEEVTIWFYKDKASIDASSPYNVALVKRTGNGSPKITR